MSKLNQHSNSTLSSVPRDAQRDQNAALSRDRNEKSSSSARHHNSEQSADARRRLTTTLSPEEAKMISHFEKEVIALISTELEQVFSHTIRIMSTECCL